MKTRLWYPQLDVYDAIRRVMGLIAAWNVDTPPSIERLCIADFYLANPPLLHKMQKTIAMMDSFRNLQIKKPEKVFLNYPSAPILFRKMEPVQSQALRTLTGKALIDIDAIQDSRVIPSKFGSEMFESTYLKHMSEDERQLTRFIVEYFCTSTFPELADIRKRTGLRRTSL